MPKGSALRHPVRVGGNMAGVRATGGSLGGTPTPITRPVRTGGNMAGSIGVPMNTPGFSVTGPSGGRSGGYNIGGNESYNIGGQQGFHQGENFGQSIGQNIGQYGGSSSSQSQSSTGVMGDMMPYYDKRLGLEQQNYANVLNAYAQGGQNLNSQLPGVYSGYGNVLGSIGGAIDKSRQAGMKDINQENATRSGSIDQQLISSGLGNSTVRGNLQNQSGYLRDRAVGDMEAKLAMQYAGAEERVGLAGQQAKMQGLGMQTGLAQAQGGALAGYGGFRTDLGDLRGQFGSSSSQSANQGMNQGMNQSQNYGYSLGANQGFNQGQSHGFNQGENASANMSGGSFSQGPTNISYTTPQQQGGPAGGGGGKTTIPGIGGSTLSGGGVGPAGPAGAAGAGGAGGAGGAAGGVSGPGGIFPPGGNPYLPGGGGYGGYYDKSGKWVPGPTNPPNNDYVPGKGPGEVPPNPDSPFNKNPDDFDPTKYDGPPLGDYEAVKGNQKWRGDMPLAEYNRRVDEMRDMGIAPPPSNWDGNINEWIALHNG